MANRILDQASHSEPATDGVDTGHVELATADASKRSAPPRRPAAAANRSAEGRGRKSAGPAAGGTAARTVAKASPLQTRSKSVGSGSKRPAGKLAPASDVSDASVVAKVAAAVPDKVADAVAAVPPAGVVRQHAVPAALVGAAVVWYLLQTKVGKSAEARLVAQAKRATGAVGSALSSLGGTAGEAYSQAADSTLGALGTAAGSVGHAAGSVGHAAGSAAGAVHDGAVSLAGFAKSGLVSAGGAIRSGAGVVGESTVVGYRRSQKAVAESWEKHPLVVGASLMAAGVTAGMFLPAPRQSGALLSRASADLSRKMSNKAGELLERGRAAIGLGGAAEPEPAPTPRRSTRTRAKSA